MGARQRRHRSVLRPTRAITEKPSNDGVRQEFGRDGYAYSGADSLGAARPRRQPRVVQRELAARRKWWPPECRISGPYNRTSHSATHSARRAVSMPNPGTSSSRLRPDGFSERGSTFARVQHLGPCSALNLIHRARSSCLAELPTHIRRSSRILSTPTSLTITTRLTPATHRCTLLMKRSLLTGQFRWNRR